MKLQGDKAMKSKWKLSTALSLVALGSVSTPAFAQRADTAANDDRGVPDIVVTATRREESLNRIPIAVQALSGETLARLNIVNLEKLVEYLPNVRTASRGPGISSIYIRGLSTDTPGAQILGVGGVQPNVALYLNDAPASTPGRNLDIYPTDLQRIEVLAGPQGTLFGASAMGGAIRYITNKPDVSEFHAGFTGTYALTRSGNNSASGEGFINIPIIKDKLAIRLVAFSVDQGGYIDNVPGTYQMPFNSGSPGKLPTGNPLLVNQAILSCVGVANCVGTANGTSAGWLAPTRQSISNSAFVKPNYNDASYVGGRAMLTYQFNDDWSLELMEMHQTLKTDGVFDYAPAVGDLQVQQYGNNTLRDTFDEATLTLKGRLGILDMIYTGSYLDHHSVQQADYAKYDNIGLFVPFYNCDNGVYYNKYNNSYTTGRTCYSPSNSYKVDDTNRRWTHEFRITTPAAARIRATAGVFYDINKTYDNTNWMYVLPAAGFIYSLTPNPLTNPLGLGPQPVGSGFINDIVRRDRQFSVYGEASFDIIPETLTITGGVRYYNEKASIEGGSNSSFSGALRGICNAAPGTGTSYANPAVCTYTPAATPPKFFSPSSVLATSLAGINPSTYSGFIFKGNLTYKIDDQKLVYATYSEGFRPGGFNRKGCNNAAGSGGLTAAQCGALRAYEPDKVHNYEIGAKIGLFDRQLQINAAAYAIDWKSIQILLFDQNVSNQAFVTNLVNARVRGFEGDINIRPKQLHGLTVSTGFSYNDSELTGCSNTGLSALCTRVTVPFGSPLALSPKFQGNMRVRYEWEMPSGLKPHVQAGVHYVGSSISSIVDNANILFYCSSPYSGCGQPATINGVTVNPGGVIQSQKNSFLQPAYHTFDASIGVTRDQWSLEIYGDNLGDARPQLYTSGNDGEVRITTARPRTIGMRVSFKI